MSSALSIIITTKADADELAIYQYISTIFGTFYAEKFRKKLIEAFHLISKQPFIGRPAKQNNSIRVLMLSKQNKIVYTLNESKIIILRILNTKSKLSESF